MEKIQIGLQKFENGEFQEAISIFTNHLNKNIADLDITYKRAIAFRRIENFNASLKDFDTLVNLQPKSADMLSERGVAKYHCNDLEGALEDMDYCVVLEPENPYRYSSRAYIKGQKRDIDGAISDYEMAIKLDPEDAIALNNLGLLEEQRGRAKSAEQKFKKSDNLLGVEKRNPKDIEIPEEVKPLTQESEDETENTSLTAQSYFQTLKGVLTSSKIRKEFFSYFFSKEKNNNKK